MVHAHGVDIRDGLYVLFQGGDLKAQKFFVEVEDVVVALDVPRHKLISYDFVVDMIYSLIKDIERILAKIRVT